MIVYPQNPPKLSDLKLDESKYDKRKDNHLESVYYHLNNNEGINYTVDVSKGVTTAIEYFPAVNDINLRCPAFSLNMDGSSTLFSASY